MTQQVTFPCQQCGASMQFDPGAVAIKCPFCGHEQAVRTERVQVVEEDFLTQLEAGEEAQCERMVIKCQACGAETTLPEHVTASTCPFCGTAIVAASYTRRLIQPRYLLPFAVQQQQAMNLFRQWLSSLWFAPNDLKKRAQPEQHKLSGMYIPYWTYDANTVSDYTGRRGEHYWETEHYTTTEDGKTVTKTRQVRRTRWYLACGTVQVAFDDLLVMASQSLPANITDKLEPWDLQSLTPYQDAFLSGFQAESYQIDLKQGFTIAQHKMVPGIECAIRRDIGGDEQRIHSVNTQYYDITYKHILLPIWVSAYRYGEKVYRFLINARTGEVQGERPWSWIKITLLVIVVLIIIGVLFYFFGSHGGQAEFGY